MMGTPSWPNHAQILDDLGLELVTFDHATADGTADLDALRDAIAGARRRAMRCCCTAAATTRPASTTRTTQWDEIADAARRQPACCRSSTSPIRASATGMEEDAYGVRTVLAAVPEALVAYSCDKNFGLYRDRVGALYALAQEPAQLGARHVERPCAGPRQLVDAARSRRRRGAADPARRGADRSIGSTSSSRCARACARSARRSPRRARSAAVDLDAARQAERPVRHAAARQGRRSQRCARITAIYMAGSGRINVAGLTMGNIDIHRRAGGCHRLIRV